MGFSIQFLTKRFCIEVSNIILIFVMASLTLQKNDFNPLELKLKVYTFIFVVL